DAPFDIHPGIGNDDCYASCPLHGSATGSFTMLYTYYLTGHAYFPTGVGFSAGTSSGDTNLPGTMDFSYRIALSTTPIDASVFAPPVSAVPEPATWLMLLVPLAGLVALRSDRRKG